MPSLKLSSELQLWYSCNSPNGDASKFDHSKETILLFHPLLLDSTWLRAQFQDPRLNNNYNLIAFDSRSSGRTKSKFSPLRDGWVDAADIGVALELLMIPRCHIFASQTNSVHAAYRFAILFPEKTLSLCLCQIPATKDFEWATPGYFELVESWCFPPDITTVERACIELCYLMFNNKIISNDLEDEVVAWWEMNFPATKRTRFLENALTCLYRQPITDRMLQHIQVPVLIMHGDKFIANPIDQAESEAARIPNAQFVVVKGGPEAFTMTPSCATVVNRVYTTFLSRVPSQPQSAQKPSKPRKDTAILTAALEHLADAFDDVRIKERTPTSLCFSMCSEERVRENKAYFKRYSEGERKAVTALGKDGLPIRKISMRYEDLWTEAAFEPRSVKFPSISGIRGYISQPVHMILPFRKAPSPLLPPPTCTVRKDLPPAFPWRHLRRFSSQEENSVAL